MLCWPALVLLGALLSPLPLHAPARWLQMHFTSHVGSKVQTQGLIFVWQVLYPLSCLLSALQNIFSQVYLNILSSQCSTQAVFQYSGQMPLGPTVWGSVSNKSNPVGQWEGSVGKGTGSKARLVYAHLHIWTRMCASLHTEHEHTHTHTMKRGNQLLQVALTVTYASLLHLQRAKKLTKTPSSSWRW